MFDAIMMENTIIDGTRVYAIRMIPAATGGGFAYDGVQLWLAVPGGAQWKQMTFSGKDAVNRAAALQGIGAGDEIPLRAITFDATGKLNWQWAIDVDRLVQVDLPAEGVSMGITMHFSVGGVGQASTMCIEVPPAETTQFSDFFQEITSHSRNLVLVDE